MLRKIKKENKNRGDAFVYNPRATKPPSRCKTCWRIHSIQYGYEFTIPTCLSECVGQWVSGSSSVREFELAPTSVLRWGFCLWASRSWRRPHLFSSPIGGTMSTTLRSGRTLSSSFSAVLMLSSPPLLWSLTLSPSSTLDSLWLFYFLRSFSIVWILYLLGIHKNGFVSSIHILISDCACQRFLCFRKLFLGNWIEFEKRFPCLFALFFKKIKKSLDYPA